MYSAGYSWDFHETRIFSTDFSKRTWISIFMKIRPTGAELSHAVCQKDMAKLSLFIISRTRLEMGMCQHSSHSLPILVLVHARLSFSTAWSHKFDVQMNVHRDSVFITKQTTCTIFSINFGIKLYMFRTIPLPIIRSFSLYKQQYIQVCWQLATRCTNFSIHFGIKLYMFRTFPLSIISSFSLYTQQWYMSYRFADSLQLDALIF